MQAEFLSALRELFLFGLHGRLLWLRELQSMSGLQIMFCTMCNVHIFFKCIPWATHIFYIYKPYIQKGQLGMKWFTTTCRKSMVTMQPACPLYGLKCLLCSMHTGVWLFQSKTNKKTNKHIFCCWSYLVIDIVSHIPAYWHWLLMGICLFSLEQPSKLTLK